MGVSLVQPLRNRVMQALGPGSLEGYRANSSGQPIQPQMLLDNYVNFDVKYAGLIPDIPTDMDPTGRTDLLKVIDVGVKDGLIPNSREKTENAVVWLNAYSIRIVSAITEEPLLVAPVHMLASVGFLREDNLNILGIKIGEIGGNKDVSDLAVVYCETPELAELMCGLLEQCFHLVFTEATRHYFDKKETEGRITNIFENPSDSASSANRGPPEASFMTGSRTDLRQASRQRRHSSTTPSESDRLSSQAADLIQEYMRMLHALLNAEELKQFAVLLKRWREGSVPFTEFCQKVLELYGSDRKHLLARMRPFVQEKDSRDFEKFLEQSGITDNAESSLASYSPGSASDGTWSRLADNSGESSAWNSLRLYMTPPIPSSALSPRPPIEESENENSVALTNPVIHLSDGISRMQVRNEPDELESRF